MVFGRKLDTDSILDKSSFKVLVADDSESARQFLVSVLSDISKKIQFIQVDNGVDALKEFVAQKPDIVLLDIMMPKADGIQTIKSMLKANQKAKVILMSTKDNISHLKARKAGARNCLIKPFDRTITKEVFGEVLAQSW